VRQVLHNNNIPPTITPHTTKRGLNAEHDVPITPLLVALPGVAVTLVATEPIVAVGGGAFTPFSPSAVAESAAKPTEAGLYLNTENTFFCVHTQSVKPKLGMGSKEVAYEERVTDDPARSRATGVDLKERANACVGTDFGKLEVG
jgi:hypothetical protein